jgi:CRISPR-associated protein Cas1
VAVVTHLYANEAGTFIGKFQERLKLMRGGETLQQAPLMHLEGVTIASMGVSISADAIAACTQRGIPIVMLDGIGHVYAALYSSGLTGTVLTRRQQLLAYYDDRGFLLARMFTLAKMANQARTLRYWAQNRAESHPDDAHHLKTLAQHLQRLGAQAEATPLLPLDEARDVLMGYEGQASALYWEGARCLTTPHYDWPQRLTRGATDPVNSLLNYGYGILYAEVERALVLAGLDPYAGFLHADRPGKPSLTLDLIEEFRQLVVDRVVFGLTARRYQIEQDEFQRLTPETRKDFAARILHQLEGKTRYEGRGRVTVRHILQMQARHIATFVRRERAYTPFIIAE